MSKRFWPRVRWRVFAAALGAGFALGAAGCERAGMPPLPGSAEWDRLSHMLTVFNELDHGIAADEYYAAPPGVETNSQKPDKSF